MKKILITTLATALLGASAPSFAQTAGPKAGTPPLSTLGKARVHKAKGHKQSREAILAKLNLTPEQKAKIEAHMNQEHAEKKILAKADGAPKGAGKSEETKEKLKALRKADKAFYKETLTKDQLKEMKAMRRAARRQAQLAPTAKP